MQAQPFKASQFEEAHQSLARSPHPVRPQGLTQELPLGQHWSRPCLSPLHRKWQAAHSAVVYFEHFGLGGWHA